MKSTKFVTISAIALAATFLLCDPAFAQEAASPKEPATSGKPASSPEALEAQFKATLTRATLSGRWCLVEDDKLGPEKEDKYVITSVTKIGSETWLIHARIQYGDRDFTIPVPVKVKWAGDTPVLVVDNLGIPGGRAYSARVVIFDQTYAGTWSGGNRRGLLNGVITNEPP